MPLKVNLPRVSSISIVCCGETTSSTSLPISCNICGNKFLISIAVEESKTKSSFGWFDLKKPYKHSLGTVAPGRYKRYIDHHGIFTNTGILVEIPKTSEISFPLILCIEETDLDVVEEAN